MIKWIDKKSVLSSGKIRYKAGDVIPADLLTKSRIQFLLENKKIEIVKNQVDSVQPEIKKPEKKTDHEQAIIESEQIAAKKNEKKKERKKVKLEVEEALLNESPE